MDLRGNPRNLESGNRLTTGNRPHRTGFGVRERLLETVRVDSIDNSIDVNYRLSPIVRSSEQTAERVH